MQLFKALHLISTSCLVLILAKTSFSTSLARITNPTTSHPPPPPLQKRTNDLSLIHFTHGTIITPLASAASSLQHFYTQLAIHSSPYGPWSLNHPRISLRITLGALQILMTATDLLTIPWSLVEWHALRMLAFAQKGYAGTYHAYYSRSDGVGRIVVSLSCLAMKGLAQAGVGAVGDAVNGVGNRAVDGAVSAVGQGLNPDAKPFNPRRAL